MEGSREGTRRERKKVGRGISKNLGLLKKDSHHNLGNLAERKGPERKWSGSRTSKCSSPEESGRERMWFCNDAGEKNLKKQKRRSFLQTSRRS